MLFEKYKLPTGIILQEYEDGGSEISIAIMRMWRRTWMISYLKLRFGRMILGLIGFALLKAEPVIVSDAVSCFVESGSKSYVAFSLCPNTFRES